MDRQVTTLARMERDLMVRLLGVGESVESGEF